MLSERETPNVSQIEETESKTGKAELKPPKLTRKKFFDSVTVTFKVHRKMATAVYFMRIKIPESPSTWISTAEGSFRNNKCCLLSQTTNAVGFVFGRSAGKSRTLRDCLHRRAAVDVWPVGTRSLSMATLITT